MICIDFNKNEKNEWSSLGFVCGHNVPEMNNAMIVNRVATQMNQETIMIRINHGFKPTEVFVVLSSNFFNFIEDEVQHKLIESARKSNKLADQG